ncbi:MAG: hypothetical protein K2J63_01515, partial [Muribaculaceae bacterium]|nr:hypothetical protein [Muribaculaceae bacterium]
EKVDTADLPTAVSEETVKRITDRALGEDQIPIDENSADEGGGGDKAPAQTDAKESCPYATRRAIVESIAEIRRFAEENKLAASVLKALLTLLAEIALGTLKGKVSRHILETLLRAVTYELDMESRYPADDDGLPHINGPLYRPDGTSIFDVAAAARN